MKAYLDSNILIAALRVDHVHHAGCFALMRRVRDGEIDGYIAAQGLAEFYSVMTRTPFTIPVDTDEAAAMVARSIMPVLTIIDVRADAYFAAIASCGRNGWRGGRIHDVVHIEAAKQAGCEVIYTHNLAHFKALAPEWADRMVTPPER